MFETSLDSDDERIGLNLQDELSKDTLDAILQFQASGFFEPDADSIIPKDTACATYTAQDSRVISETYRRLQAKEDEASKAHTIKVERKIIDLAPPLLSPDETNAGVLLREGVVRINQVLDVDLCDRCLTDLNAALMEKEALQKDTETTNGFGDVYSINCRHDMYLRNEGTAGEALENLLHGGTELADLLLECLPPGQPGVFHEFAALMTDPGAASQPIHPDSKYAKQAPLWTIFVALQDIDMTMGPTIFLPHTHESDAHDSFTAGDDQKNELLASSEYRRSVLKKGDAAVMDSRCLHFGDSNVSEGKRRVLLYMTIRNPLHSKTGAEEDYPPCGSKWQDVHLSTHDFL